MKNIVCLTIVALVICLIPQSLSAQVQTMEQSWNRIQNSASDPNRAYRVQQQQQQRAAEQARMEAEWAHQAALERENALRKKYQATTKKQDSLIKSTSKLRKWDDATNTTVLTYIDLARANLPNTVSLDDTYFKSILSYATNTVKNGEQADDLSSFASGITDYWQEQLNKSKSKKNKSQAESYVTFTQKIEKKIAQKK